MPSQPSPEQGPAAVDEIRGFLADNPDIKQIDALLADSCGVLRGKKMPVRGLRRLPEAGVSFPGSIYGTDITGSTVEATGLGLAQGDADRPCYPIPGTLRPVPWANRPTGQVLLAMHEADGDPFFADPRAVLGRVVDRLATDGLTPVVAVELEFYLIDRRRRPDGSPQPPRGPDSGRRQSTTQVYGIDELYEFDELLHDIDEAARVQAIPIDAAISEYAPGQYEINLHHTDRPIRAADDAVLFKRIVKGVAHRHGVEATFMAKPYPLLAGNGLHVHLSLLDRNGDNVFAAEDSAGTPALRHAIGGLAATMAEGMALFAQNVNAFRRFQPNSYAPHAPTWAINNRSCALRVPASGSADRRVEHRVAGADSNIYLVLAAVLAGAHYGLDRKIDPGPPTSGNAYELEKAVLTSSWYDALEQLSRSTMFADYFGPEYLDVYLALKRAERDQFLAAITPLEYEWYLSKV
ncbi:MAG: glutamine synthetase [Inquilinus sp.]|nr:glutamine synthetase [Inquilinus sp.]